MTKSCWVGLVLTMVSAADAVFALEPRRGQDHQISSSGARFEALTIEDPSLTLSVGSASIEEADLPAGLRTGWDAFEKAHGRGWRAFLDRRTGAPLLVEGPGIPWLRGAGPPGRPGGSPGSGAAAPTVESLADSLRTFVSRHVSLLRASDRELVLNRAGSASLTPDLRQIVFDREVAGIPVLGERYLFFIGHGNLIAFGATRWSTITASATPSIGREEALRKLLDFMGVTSSDHIEHVDDGALAFTPLSPPGIPGTAYEGVLGGGSDAALTWRFTLRVSGGPETWIGAVDAHSGRILAFYDGNLYADVKGGVFPLSNDQICPDGCEQPGYPMPFADLTIDGMPTVANRSGRFECAPGATATTTLAGPYARINDQCGPVSQSTVCEADLDLGTFPGVNCDVAPGASPGNTHAARTAFYLVNRMNERARGWLPGVPWLSTQLELIVNGENQCNAIASPINIRFRKSGTICRNTGEIAGVVLHEWGHTLDFNDGLFDLDSPPEGSADINAVVATHVSCVGRGFRSTNCTGFGNTCLDCTGVREVDWARKADHVPSTPGGFVATYCEAGGGPCGREIHCEGQVVGEAMWDLAVRDLPASGLDQARAWHLTAKLWYLSRPGSGGNLYSCALPSSNGCAAGSLYSKLRLVDDDDGSLLNGTPHAAAIFAAFDRHAIACGAASDPANQSTSSCPELPAPDLSAQGLTQKALLEWTPVENAARYSVLRTDAGCGGAFTIAGQVKGTSFIDATLVDGFAQYYAVQAHGANSACDGPLSNCVAVTPHPSAGDVTTGAEIVGCASTLTVRVRDDNIGSDIVFATVRSATEPGGEKVRLTRIAPGSPHYEGTISMTPLPPSADGLLSLTDGETVTVSYIDADDGAGNYGRERRHEVLADCRAPALTAVGASFVLTESAVVQWTSSEPATSRLHYGTTAPPASTVAAGDLVLSHSLPIAGLEPCTSYLYSVESVDAYGNAALDDNGGAYYGFRTQTRGATLGALNATVVTIPDNSTIGATSTITINDPRHVVDVNVAVNIIHSLDSQLVLTLMAPNGATIVLSDRRGANRNFTDTIFDDEAALAISSGVPPFTGAFRPETPLSAADLIAAQGAWRLKVVDTMQGAVGSIRSWRLYLTYAEPCDPLAAYRSSTLVMDTCIAGGAGHDDGAADAGEDARFAVDLQNTGEVPLTGVSATITPLTAGVTMVDSSASFGGLPIGAAGTTLPPHFTARLSEEISCGEPLDYRIDVASDQGAWSETFRSFAGGLAISTALSETFSGGIPAGWTIVDNGTGGTVAATWTTANPGLRTLLPPLASPVAIVDSDRAGPGAAQDEELITPAIDLSSAVGAVLELDQVFHWSAAGLEERGDIDVRSSATGMAWVNIFRNRSSSSPDPDHRKIDLTPFAAGATGVQIRFHAYSGMGEGWWAIDNVVVIALSLASCTMTPCITGPTLPPVPDGTFGFPMSAQRVDPAGSTIALAWDAATCTAAGYHLLYGALSNVASYDLDGGVCGLGTSGSFVWPSVPAGNLWFVIVSNDGAGMEGTWGTDSSGQHRAGSAPSGQCGMAARTNVGACP